VPTVSTDAGGGGYIAKARSDVVRGSLWTVLATTLGAPIGLVANVFVARSLGTHGLGRFGTYTAVFAVVIAVTNLGWSDATVQWLASATAREAPEERRELIRRSAGFHLFLSGPAAALCTLWLLSGAGVATAAVGAISVWVMQGLSTSTIVNTASARNALAAQIALIVGTGAQVALVAAALATHRADTTWAVQLVFLFIGPLLAVVKLDPEERAALFAPKLVLRAPQGFWTYAASACVGGLLATLVYGRSEVIVLRANHLLVGAGIFTVITGLAGQMTAILDSMLAPLTPIAAGLVAIDRARAIRVFERSLRVTAVFGALATCILVPAGVLAIRVLYGRAFESAVAPFGVLALISSLQTALGPISAFAFATRSAAQVLRINLVCLVVDAAVAFACVPLFGLWGAVVANGVAQVLSLLWMAKLVSTRLGLNLSAIVKPLRLFVAALVLGAVEAAVSVVLHGTAELGILGVIVAGLIALRVLLGQFPQLQLTDDDIGIISGASSSRKLRALVGLLTRAGIASGRTPDARR
jgi:O-antigen/teichoic acid export membrane protein